MRIKIDRTDRFEKQWPRIICDSGAVRENDQPVKFASHEKAITYVVGENGPEN